ncbi:hypothetical protein [Flavobacterium aciduliphilum]|uniref:Uncharacterized protein n=1 Tax=Flavobacterium aciduliphilum TaxID=1101402 RepID=A0A328YG48_9FLAO|nr:hypothetical protein [Flavobacterium aciduliphilum]RAR72929.1 hypothetical protein CLV55_104190 [Flavobacterium aciduliphilum]
MDYKVIISIYAALISTIVFIWRIYEFYHDRRGKFNIEINKIYKVPMSNSIMSKGVDFLVIKITNVSKNKRYIDEPSFVSNSKNKKFFNLLLFDKKVKYPLPLESGETHEYSVEFNQIIDELKQHNISKIKTILRDTHNKKYYSDWFEFKT